MHCTRVIIPNRAHSNPRLKPLTSLITENFFFHWLKSSAKENRVDCAFAIRSTCRFQSSPCLRHSGPRSLFFFCLPTASLFWAFLLSVLISPKLFVLYPKISTVHLFTTVSFDFETNRGASYSILSPIYPKFNLTHHVGGGGDRGRSMCGSQ